MKDAEDEAFEAIEKAQGWRKRQIAEQKEKPMTEREALKLALEALGKIADVNAMDYEYQRWAKEAYLAIKQALAQPEQKKCENCGEFGECCQAQPDEQLLVANILSEYGLEAIDFVAEFKKAMAQPTVKDSLTVQPERNFCPRCGKRLGKNDWDVHTCTPPLGKE